MTVADFWEVGASGQRYSRDYILNIWNVTPDRTLMCGRLPNFRSVVLVYDPTTEFHCRKLAEDVYLLTYTLTQSEERKTLRSTIWQHTAQGWQIVYHQGTIVQDV